MCTSGAALIIACPGVALTGLRAAGKSGALRVTMAKRTREAPVSIAKRLTKKLPKLSPLLREGFKSLWTEAQCEAWAKRAKPTDVLAQSHDWLVVLGKALEAEGHEDLPCSAQRLAWLAELTVELEHAVSGQPKAQVVAAKQARDGALADAKQLRARVLSRMLLLVGGDEERSAALAIARQGRAGAAEVETSLTQLGELLGRWRRDARLRLLADELSLDEGLLQRVGTLARLLHDADLQAEAVAPSRPGPAQRLEGRLLKELRALQLAVLAARAEGLTVPQLKVRPALKAVLTPTAEATEPNARVAFVG